MDYISNYKLDRLEKEADRQSWIDLLILANVVIWGITLLIAFNLY